MPTEPGHCINNEEVFVAGGTINVVSDFTILLLPIVEVWRLQMSIQRKIGVSAVFATGLLYVRCVCERERLKADFPQRLHLKHHAPCHKRCQRPKPRQDLLSIPRRIMDVSLTSLRLLHPFHELTVQFNSIAEIASGIVCGCLITMPHFFRHFAPKIASKLSLSRHSRSTGASKLAPFVPVRASKVPDWSGAYESAATRGKDDYMELGESNTWQGPATTILHVDDDGAVRGRNEWGDQQGGRGPVASLPSNVTSIYSDDYPRADSPHSMKSPIRR